jgi:hypothetical protein
MKSTIQHTDIETDASGANSSGRVKPLFCEPSTERQCLRGESLLMTASFGTQSTNAGTRKTVSTVQFSETTIPKPICPATLSDRLTQSLISAGLVKGIIPTSMRKRSGVQMLDFVSSRPDGDDAEKPKAG